MQQRETERVSAVFIDNFKRVDTSDLEYFYPGDVLVTGYDIIFFWVARMIFSGLEHMRKVPFRGLTSSIYQSQKSDHIKSYIIWQAMPKRVPQI